MHKKGENNWTPEDADLLLLPFGLVQEMKTRFVWADTFGTPRRIQWELSPACYVSSPSFDVCKVVYHVDEY